MHACVPFITSKFPRILTLAFCLLFLFEVVFYERNKTDLLIKERGTKHTSKAPKMFPTDALALHIPNTIPRLQKIKSNRYSFQNM